MAVPTTKHEYERVTGRRISHGAWERMTTVHEVHLSKVRVLTNPVDGSKVIQRRFTNTLHRQTPKFRRKNVQEFIKSNGTLDRYRRNPAGAIAYDRKWTEDFK